MILLFLSVFFWQKVILVPKFSSYHKPSGIGTAHCCIYFEKTGFGILICHDSMESLLSEDQDKQRSDRLRMFSLSQLSERTCLGNPADTADILSYLLVSVDVRFTKIL